MAWTTFWTAVAAISSLVTALIALWAVFRWKKQDELKAKLSFKSAISNYSYVLVLMPDDLSAPHVRRSFKDQSKQLIDQYAACKHAWFITEGLLDNYHSVKSDWEVIEKNHSLFLCGEVNNLELGAACISILQEKFVFK